MVSSTDIRKAGIDAANKVAATRIKEFLRGQEEARVAAFHAHWAALAKHQNELLPHLRSFLDRPAPLLQPHVALIDIYSEDVFPIRLYGTGRSDNFGREVTGANALDFCLPDIRRAIAASVALIVKMPCGWLTRRILTTTRGGSARALSLTLPLATDPGKAPCIANFTALQEMLPQPSGPAAVTVLQDGQWLDVGAGIPSVPAIP